MLSANCLLENKASQRLLEKVGFQNIFEGVSKSFPSKGREVVIYEAANDDLISLVANLKSFNQ